MYLYLSICGLNGVKWPTTAAGGVHNNNNIIYIKAKTGTTYSRRSVRSWIHTQTHTHERRGNLRHLWATRSQLKFSFNCDLTFSTSCRLVGCLWWDGKFPGTWKHSLITRTLPQCNRRRKRRMTKTSAPRNLHIMFYIICSSFRCYLPLWLLLETLLLQY